MKTIELRRHAQRQPDEDRLSPAGRELATRVGSTIGEPFDLVFVSPASRASETAALLAPDRTAIRVDGLGSDAEPGELANVVRNLFGELTDGSRALAVGHTPLIEKAVLGLTGREIASLGECEGVRVVDEEGRYGIEEVRL